MQKITSPVGMSGLRVTSSPRGDSAGSWGNPVGELEDGERPRTGVTAKRRLYTSDELAQTLAAAHQPYRTLFSSAAVTGARLSECLGLVWEDLELADVQVATVSFRVQVDRRGRRQPLKTEESQRTIELPAALASILAQHRLRSLHSRSGDFIFSTRSGRALSQRNVLRALRAAQSRALDSDACPAFPELHRCDPRRRWIPPPPGAVPSFHSFRHTAASRAIAAGESAEEVAWQLGHRNSTVTRAVYIQEIKSAPNELVAVAQGWTLNTHPCWRGWPLARQRVLPAERRASPRLSPTPSARRGPPRRLATSSCTASATDAFRRNAR